MTLPQTDRSPLSYCGGEARRHDNDRFLTALFAPAAAQEAVFALIAFNQEVARTREVVSEPALGLMRLQWWRDAVAACYGEGPLPHHPVAEPLAVAVRDFALSRDLFEQLIDAREADLEDEPPPTAAALETYAESTAAPLQRLMLEALGVRDDAAHAAATDAAVAYALTGILRATTVLARRGKVLLPSELLEKHGLRRRSVLEGEASPQLAACVADVAALARSRLAAARSQRSSVPKAARPALLAATQAGLALGRLGKAGYMPFSPLVLLPNPWRHAALAWAAFSGRF
jgi:NADH dehydrogenase [ubiquinone] 1 alpha subcomplex assembly factor 6